MSAPPLPLTTTGGTTARRARIGDGHFLLLWTVVNLVQVALTELTSDEGYYWFWSTRLEWGYYEHPPLLPLLMRIGTSLFGGEFGVRACDVLLMSVGLGFFLRTMHPRQKPCAYVILLGLPLLNYVTFVSFPDSPLVGLAGITLYVYQRYLARDDLKLALLLALLVALMFYAKYHTILFVIFLLLSHPRLLARRNVWIAGFVAAALYVPHLWWEHTHGYPTFLFHLVGRSTRGFELANLVDYTWQQILVIGVGLIWVPFVHRAEGQYERTLRTIAIGTLAFFLLGTVRGYVHLHWTAIAVLPVAHLASDYYASRMRTVRFALLVWPNVLFLLLLRVVFAVPVLPHAKWNADHYHGRREWAQDIRAVAGDLPVVFETGYRGLRQAGLYQFYAGGWSMALYPGEHKKSQYQIWDYEDLVQGKPVLLVTEPRPGTQRLETRMGRTLHHRRIDEFVSYNNIAIGYDDAGESANDDGRHLRLRIRNHRAAPLGFRRNDRIYVELRGADGQTIQIVRPLGGLAPMAPGQEARVEVSLSPDEIGPGTYSMVAGFFNPYTILSVNSKRRSIVLGSAP